MPDIKQKAWRNDAFAKVTGKAKFADDLKFNGMLHAVPVYTDYVHARIEGIDVEQARNMEGVVAVLTAADVPGQIRWGQIQQDYHMLCEDKIRYNGDVIALIVAESREQALAAMPHVTIKARPLPKVLDAEQAMQPDAPLVHDDKGTNLVVHHKVRRGDPAEIDKKHDITVEHRFETQFVEHAYIEPESAVCVPRGDGVMEVYGSMQHPFSTRRFVAAMMGVSLNEVEVISIPMGGGFGGKDDTSAIVCARAALAASITGCPVKMTYDREWSMRESYKRHPYRVDYKMNVAKDGTIRAVKTRIVADAGAYCSVTPWVTWRSTVQCCGPYSVPNVHCDVYGVHTNNVFTGAMRGFGSPQMNFVIEQMVEEAAEQCGMDGVAFRRKNMLRQGEETITGQKLDGHTVSLEQVMDEVITAIDYHKKLKPCSRGKANGDKLYGIGLAVSYRGMSLGAEGKDFCAAIINVQFDGSILLESGIHENGQGSESAFILLLAREMGVNHDRIRYRRSSTSVIPDSGTTVASRGTLMGGGAVVNAARKLKSMMAETVAAQLGCDAQHIVFDGEHLRAKDSGKSISFDETIREMYQKQNFPHAFGVFKSPKVSWNEETGQGKAYFTWVYGCQAVELQVDARNGRVKLLNAVAAHDVGRAVNPPMVLGQYYGGMAMGMGYGLKEAVQINDGKISNDNFNHYHIARATDMPDMKAIIIENADPLSPSRAKGIGEPTNEIMAPAIANAVYNATGVRYYTSPITIEI
ncbi:MAG: molybdopterin-dependent oxidoreductase [Caldithrix sp.]|nr:molybdopterin-dependent oxidoreductase [Caldithrix sp.]